MYSNICNAMDFGEKDYDKNAIRPIERQRHKEHKGYAKKPPNQYHTD
ncbi:MAG: hypothetical protein H6Q68_708 [Firmicutes bacterium]|nr:hypothetical protein [Bacillota bacterium]